MLPADLGEQLDISLRLLFASVLGAAVGIEREVHAHPAGMRTHLLVSLGAAAFTVLSIFFFERATGPAIATDPSRIAAQVVSGVGFLVAGTILKFGSSVRGLTTAASLWATAAVGMAAGAGAWVVAVLATVLIILSLGPLNWITKRLGLRQEQLFRLRLVVGRLEALGEITRMLIARKIEIAGVSSQRAGKDRYEIELNIKPPASEMEATIIAAVAAVPDVEILEAGSPTE